MRAWSKSWLPLLFKCFLESPPEERDPLGAAVSALAGVAEPGVLAPLFRAVMVKLVKVRAGRGGGLAGVGLLAFYK